MAFDWGGYDSGLWRADRVSVDTDNFDGLLTASDDDVQLALETIDDIVIDNIPTNLLAGSVVFSNGSFLTEDNTNFFWDDASNFLKLGNDSEIQFRDGDQAIFSPGTSQLTIKNGGFGRIFLDVGGNIFAQPNSILLKNIIGSGSNNATVWGYDNDLQHTDTGALGPIIMGHSNNIAGTSGVILAIGTDNTVSGFGSQAMGLQNAAVGIGNVAIGGGNGVNCLFQGTAIGVQNSITGTGISTVLGQQMTMTGITSFGCGLLSTINGAGVTAFVRTSTISGDNGFTVGSNCLVNGNLATVLGSNIEQSGNNGLTIGTGVAGGASRLVNATGDGYIGHVSTLPSIILKAGAVGVLGDVEMKSLLQYDNGVKPNLTLIADAAYAVLSTDHNIQQTPTALRRMTLIDPTTNADQEFTFINHYNGTNNMDFSRTVNGVAVGGVLVTPSNSLTIYSDGTEYIVR